MNFRKPLCLLLAALLCSGAAFATGDTAPEGADPAAGSVEATAAAVPVSGLAEDAPQLNSVSAALLCAENGELLLDKGAEKRLAPASITKLMTALVVLDRVTDLSAMATVSYEAVHSIEPGSTHIALDTDEVVSLRDLMGAMLVESANDASNVLAEYVGGSLEGFAGLMNEKAAELGCRDTHFVNANGLDDPDHYTTAYDMALITRALVQHPEFAEFAGARTYEIGPTNKQAEPREFGTKQNFLNPNSQWYDEDVVGGKNGWTTNAHHTLVTVKQKDGVTLIAVAMCNSSKLNALTDVAALFQYGYDKFHAVTLSPERQAEAAQAAYPNADVDALGSALVLLPEGMKEKDLSLACLSDASDPALTVRAGTVELLSIPLTLLSAGAPANSEQDGETVPAMGVRPETGSLGGTLLRGGLIALGVVVGLFALLCLYRFTRIRKQRRRIRALRAQARRRDGGGRER